MPDAIFGLFENPVPENNLDGESGAAFQLKLVAPAAEAALLLHQPTLNSLSSFALARGRKRTTRAGMPTTIALSGTSFVTTHPAPTTAPVPILMPGMIVACAPIHTSSPMKIALSIIVPYI